MDLYNDAIKMLLPHQKEVLPKIIEILQKHKFFRDVSKGGSDKSEIIFILAKIFGISISYITNKYLISKYQELSKKYNIEIGFCITYEKLRGKGEKCSHPWLKKCNDGYIATENLKVLIKNGTLMVFDDYQKANNANLWQYKACFTIVTEIIKSSTSYLALLSNTPINKKEYISSIPWVYDNYNISQLENYCLTIDQLKTNKIIKQCLNSEILYYNLITEVLIPAVTIKMHKVYKIINCIQNRFYTINNIDYAKLSDNSIRLIRSYGLAIAKGNMTISKNIDSEYNRLSEHIKIKIVANEIRRLKLEDLTAKFLICAWRLDTPDLLKKLLPEYVNKIGVMTVKTKEEERIRIKNKFQEPNDDLFIMIGNPDLCVDWDDRKCITFILVSPKIITMLQNTNTTNIFSSKSDSYTILMFIKGVAQEMSIFNIYVNHIKLLSNIRGIENFPMKIIYNDENILHL